VQKSQFPIIPFIRTWHTRSASIPLHKMNRSILLSMPGFARRGRPSKSLAIAVLVVMLSIVIWVVSSQLGWLR